MLSLFITPRSDFKEVLQNLRVTESTLNNGGLKILISGLDNWVAEIITCRNRVLIVENINKSIDTPKANFTDTEIDMSQGDAIIITDDEDELLPPPEYMLKGILPCCNVVDSNNMNNEPIIYFVTNHPNEYPFRKSSYFTSTCSVRCQCDKCSA
ncbi:hypothetical protein CDAR_174781 [Caerostris darwini]|uniref:Uncharacterized protein n=1 Tax=Caerostris darwini TaxID=1538125 RepID=A0AAV4VQF2_9ARAC|nr:hypothetical protein CDAR_174781 [Caerostris darwini]